MDRYVWSGSMDVRLGRPASDKLRGPMRGALARGGVVVFGLVLITASCSGEVLVSGTTAGGTGGQGGVTTTSGTAGQGGVTTTSGTAGQGGGTTGGGGAEGGTSPVCSSGTADCDGIASNGCETDTTSDGHHCGDCGNDCAPNLSDPWPCCDGQCPPLCCDEPGWINCSPDPCQCTDCYWLGTEPFPCGSCACAGPIFHASGACIDETCTIAGCDLGYADCDGVYSNGCEVDTTSDPLHCGNCDTPCPPGAPCLGGNCA